MESIFGRIEKEVDIYNTKFWGYLIKIDFVYENKFVCLAYLEL